MPHILQLKTYRNNFKYSFIKVSKSLKNLLMQTHIWLLAHMESDVISGVPFNKYKTLALPTMQNIIHYSAADNK